MEFYLRWLDRPRHPRSRSLFSCNRRVDDIKMTYMAIKVGLVNGSHSIIIITPVCCNTIKFYNGPGGFCRPGSLPPLTTIRRSI